MEAAYLARCGACAKSYRVPRADRTYRCKSCGGALSIEASAPASEPTPAAPKVVLDEQRACPECHALQVKSEPFCAECGAALEGGASGRSHAERVERREAAEAMRRASNLLRLPRFLLLFSFTVNLLAAVGSAIVLADAEADTAAAFVTTGVFAAVAAVSWVAYRLLRHQPLLWTLLHASMGTLNAAFSVLASFEQDAAGTELAMTLVVWGVWLLVVWWIVLSGAKLQRLRRLHPDLYASIVLADTVPARARRSSPGAAERALEIQDHAKRKAVRGALIAGAVVFVVPLSLAGVMSVVFRGESLDVVSQRFATAWAGGEVEALAELCVGNEAAQVRGRLQRLEAANAWPKGKWPELTISAEDDVVSNGDLASTVFALSDDASVGVGWRNTAYGWKVFELELPGPPITARAEEFVRAWKSGELSQLMALFPEAVREERTRSTERFLEKFGWPASKDDITARRTRRVRHDRCEATFDAAGGRTLDVYFETDDNFVWWITSVRSPVR